MIEISIVIPTYNRKESLRKCLRSLIGQDFPADRFELIVVDDGSDCAVESLVADLRGGFSNLVYVQQENKGPACARNAGVRLAGGDLVAFVDDDCIANGEWVRLMVEEHRRDPRAAAVGGRTLTSSRKTPVIVSQFLSTISIEADVRGRSEVIFFPTCNVSLKKSVLADHAFNERFPLPGGEDLEFFWRLHRAGLRLVWSRRIELTHDRRDTLRSFLAQAYIYGRGNFLVKHLHQDHPLLTELQTGTLSFWPALLGSIIKIPHFARLLGGRLIEEARVSAIDEKSSVYAYFAMHKIFYLVGNIVEFFKVAGKRPAAVEPDRPVPRLLILDITHACNLRCRICDIWKTGAGEPEIDSAHIKKMLGEAKGLGIPAITLSGGEPLLRKDIGDILDHARRLGIRNLGVLTNGIVVKEKIGLLMPYLQDNTISLIVSLDSLRAEVHDHIRNSPAAHRLTTAALRELSALKKEDTRINFNVITIILDQNLEELTAIAEFVRALGANSLQFQALLSNNLKLAERKQSEFWVPERRLPQLDAAIDALLGLKEAHPEFIRNSGANLALIKKYYRGALAPGEARCVSAGRTVLASNQGRCTTCFSSYGDIKTTGLASILSSPERIEAQEKAGRCRWPCLLPCFCDH